MVRNSQTSIEINGKRYDARTGRMLTSDDIGTPSQTSPIDRHRHPVNDINPRQPTPQVHKPLERSKTLMRHAVKKPAADKPVHHSTSTKALSDVSFRPNNNLAPSSTLLHQFDRDRETRAHNIQRSNLVSKFSDISSKPSGAVSGAHSQHEVQKRVQPLSVQAAPALQLPVRLLHSKTELMLTKGLQTAQSHTETQPHNAHRRKTTKAARYMTLAASSLSVLMLAGFIAYQNLPNMAMRYAATRAGISAQLPGYKPAGFALNNRIHYNPGQITINFASNSDDRNFSITQRSTSWDSKALLSNYVATASDQIQTYEDKGRTIYIYDESNATWVNGGVWYDINGSSKLNSDQLIRIATSM
ncbi:DUF4367 domain-containing protein [Candidatus Saccharibacteria bacterium]|nr:DUF4367 domain-containing protein [Candidatus Saccharibacteria bacterium]